MKFPSNLAIGAVKVLDTVKKYSPQIMMGFGAVTSVLAIVEAIKQTPKAIDILEDHRAFAEQEKEALAEGDPRYGEKEYKANMGKLYISTGTKLAKTYAMPVVMEVASLACFFGARHILDVRNKALTTALAASVDTFNSYRNRVIDEIGPEREEKIRLGSEEVKATTYVMDEAGNEHKIKEKFTIVDPKKFDSLYDIIWMDGDPGYDQSEELRKFYVQEVQNYFNKILYENELVSMVSLNEFRKHFKNSKEAYTELGQIVGWDKNSDDGAVIIRMKDVSIPDEDNPNIFHNATILMPNISGSIVKEFIE